MRCSSGASATTSARERPPTPSRSPRSCSSSRRSALTAEMLDDAEHQAHPLLRRHRLSRLAAPAGLADGSSKSWKTPSHQLTGARPATDASGRTDAGVHALGQVVHFLTASRHSTETFVRALNALLPHDVRVLSAEEKPQAFHATLDAKSKRYRYVIDNGPIASPFQLRYSWHVRPPLDAAAMDRAGGLLLGRHDFHSFETDWPNRTSSVRTILDLTVERSGVVRHDRGRGRRFPVQYGPVDRRHARCWWGPASVPRRGWPKCSRPRTGSRRGRRRRPQGCSWSRSTMASDTQMSPIVRYVSSRARRRLRGQLRCGSSTSSPG